MTRNRSSRCLGHGVAVGLALILWLAPAAPARADSENIAVEGSLGAGAALATLVYAPIKLLYAVGGMTLSGVTWLWTWGDSGVAKTVARVSTDGDYVVTPAHLQRESDLTFNGQ